MASSFRAFRRGVALLIALWVIQQLFFLVSYEKKLAEGESVVAERERILDAFLEDPIGTNHRIVFVEEDTEESAEEDIGEDAEEDIGEDTEESAEEDNGKDTEESADERNIGPRIVILAGPHKAASTTIQTYFDIYTGLTVPLLPNTDVEMRKPDEMLKSTNWVWPIGVEEEYRGKNSSLAAGFFKVGKGTNKFYAALANFVGGNRAFFDDWESTVKDPSRLFKYFRLLFREPWEEGKNIIFGSEEFDSLIKSLHATTAGEEGEELHIAPESNERIGWLLDLLPWESDATDFKTTRTPPLHLEDIEVVITHRTPRLSHLESFWRQVGKTRTLREFLLSPKSKPKLHGFNQWVYTINSLALALQFVRKGIKTTIVHLQGVLENEAAVGEMPGTTGGLPAVIACEVLKMKNKKGKSMCDKQGRLHLTALGNWNARTNQNPKGLDEEQLAAINNALEEYDCGIWFHLQKYQANGTLRILHPSKDLFANCKKSTGELSFGGLIERVVSIAREEPTNSSSSALP